MKYNALYEAYHFRTWNIFSCHFYLHASGFSGFEHLFPLSGLVRRDCGWVDGDVSWLVTGLNACSMDIMSSEDNPTGYVRRFGFFGFSRTTQVAPTHGDNGELAFKDPSVGEILVEPGGKYVCAVKPDNGVAQAVIASHDVVEGRKISSRVPVGPGDVIIYYPGPAGVVSITVRNNERQDSMLVVYP